MRAAPMTSHRRISPGPNSFAAVLRDRDFEEIPHGRVGARDVEAGAGEPRSITAGTVCSAKRRRCGTAEAPTRGRDTAGVMPRLLQTVGHTGRYCAPAAIWAMMAHEPHEDVKRREREMSDRSLLVVREFRPERLRRRVDVPARVQVRCAASREPGCSPPSVRPIMST